MKISVIIAVYNDPQLKQCLESIFKSEGADFEAIVVDDGSTSVNVKKITEKYPGCKMFSFKKNKGPAAARNFGAKKASGEIIFFIDSDAQVYPDTLKKIIKRFKKDSTINAVTIAWSDEAIKKNFFNKFKAIESNYLINNLITGSFGSNGSAIYKKIFLAEGGFDENFKTAHAEDFYLGLKLYGKKYKIVLDKNILMKNSYLDKFFSQGLKKYSKRAFLRAIVLYQIKTKTETSYNSKKFKILYFLSGLIMGLIILSFVFMPLLWLALLFYIIFFYLNRNLYLKFYKKHGIIFSIKAVLLHYFYILIVSISGIIGLIYAFLFKEKNAL